MALTLTQENKLVIEVADLPFRGILAFPKIPLKTLFSYDEREQRNKGY